MANLSLFRDTRDTIANENCSEEAQLSLCIHMYTVITCVSNRLSPSVHISFTIVGRRFTALKNIFLLPLFNDKANTEFKV